MKKVKFLILFLIIFNYLLLTLMPNILASYDASNLDEESDYGEHNGENNPIYKYLTHQGHKGEGFYNETITENADKLNDKDSLQTILKQFGKRISGDNFEINNSDDEVKWVIWAAMRYVEDTSYTNIAKNNDIEYICLLQKAIERARTYFAGERSKVSGEASKYEEIAIIELLGKNEITYKINAAISYATENYRKIDTSNFTDKAYSAANILKQSEEKITGLNVKIVDNYRTKFMYTLEQIIEYANYFWGIDTSDQDILNKVHGAKVQATNAGYPNVATRTDLYIDKSQSYETKMSYDADEIWLYIQIWGMDFNVDTAEEEGILAVEWMNMLENGNHTSFYNQNVIHSTTSSNTMFNGATDAGYDTSTIGLAMGHLNRIENVTEDGIKYIDNIQAQVLNKNVDELLEQIEDNHVDEEEYEHPKRTSSYAEASSTNMDDTMTKADAFVAEGDSEKIDTSELQNFSKMLYNILLVVGIIVAVIVGGIIGIKFMLGSAGEKADVKKLLIPYVVGCIVVFGAFGIWKLVVTILSSI